MTSTRVKCEQTERGQLILGEREDLQCSQGPESPHLRQLILLQVQNEQMTTDTERIRIAQI